MTDILVKYAEAQESLGGGCSDGYCCVRRPKGMHTNGGCRCLYNPDFVTTQRAAQVLRLAQEMAEIISILRQDEGLMK